MNVTTTDTGVAVKRAAWNDDDKNKIKLSQHVSTCIVMFNINGKCLNLLPYSCITEINCLIGAHKKILEYMYSYEVQIVSFAFQDFRHPLYLYVKLYSRTCECR